MRTTLSLLTVFISSMLANAAIYIQPVEELVPQAEIVVVGTLTQGADLDGKHTGEITISKVLYGAKLEPKDKIEVHWSPKPKNLDPKLAHTADYVFAPKTGTESVFVIQQKRDKKSTYSLDWGTQYPAADEEKIQKLVARGMDFDFIGKTEADAIALAKKLSIPARVVMRDGESFPVTLDYNMDRINFTVEKGEVVSVKRG